MPAVFSVGQYLTAAQMTALAAQAAGGGDYVPPVQLLAAPAATVTFPLIPTTLRSIKVEWTARSNDPGFAAHGISLRINGDATATAYLQQYTQASHTTVVASASTASSLGVGVMPSATAAANSFGRGEVRISGWNSPHSGYLGLSFESMFHNGGTTDWQQTGGGLYIPAGPYTSLNILCGAGQFVAGSMFRLVGQT